ncbi:hypothetical protein O1611_g67 [Lasiodiplodia mahajangana]|uniref:Uncharacterized protein n=1 Tax=Lasiodiplodia mahajangana TaxID=1108764 RepID=A0ACC2K1K9_9PEZI|nr:hypothetical protein O1611_g67 [Lasiodiplodia mahajangana]
MIETRSQGASQISIGLEKTQTSVDEAQSAALKAIDESLSRLNRLGVTICRSGYDKFDPRVQKFANTSSDLKLFEPLCARAVKILYPDAHGLLIEYLIRLMIGQYERMSFAKNRQEQLKARREPRAGLPPIPEEQMTDFQGNIRATHSVKVDVNPITANIPQMPIPASQSDLTGVNSHYIRSRSKAPDEASTKRYKTSSIQVSRGNYPQPPAPDVESGIRTCTWCNTPLNRTLSESEWRRHVDQHFKPYSCLSEECSQQHPSYPTFDEWFQHMGLHSRRWNERIYLTSSWVCIVCGCNPDVYKGPRELSSHIEKCHHSDFTSEEIQVISRQSKMEQPRAWNGCLLCHFVIEGHGENAGVVFPKRAKGEVKQGGTKVARNNLSTMNPDPHTPVTALSDSSSDSDDTGSRFIRQHQFEDRSKLVARHIAAHLQTLMLLTLRFADVCSFRSDVDGDVKSDVDERNCSSECDDLRKLSEVASEIDISADIAKEDMSIEEAMDIDTAGAVFVPDTSLDFSDIPRQHDRFIREKGQQLASRVIESARRRTNFLMLHPFLPVSAIDEIITTDIIEAWCPWFQKAFNPTLARQKAERTKKLCAILSLCDKQTITWDLISEGLSDEDLPLSKLHEEGHATDSDILVSHNGKKFESFSKLEGNVAVDFLTKQWLTLAPVFTIQGEHININENNPLPFYGLRKIQSPGLSGTLYRGMLHAAHVTFETPKPEGGVEIAIKHQFLEEDFWKEKRNLEAIQLLHHAQLIRHIATIQRGEDFYIIYPWASGGGLCDFWKKHPDALPARNPEVFMWCFRQMLGLVDALAALHSINCRHGDLKPANILHFGASSDPPLEAIPDGTLVIADVRVSQIHKLPSKLRVDPDENYTTPMYEAPEAEFDRYAPRRRRYDIWSVGCIFMEFAIWLLYGEKAINKFREHRVLNDQYYRRGAFYNCIGEGTAEVTAVIHPDVSNGFEALRNDPRCGKNTALADLIFLISNDLIVIDPGKRMKSKELKERFKIIVEKAEREPDYLIRRTEPPPSTPEIFMPVGPRGIVQDAAAHNRSPHNHHTIKLTRWATVKALLGDYSPTLLHAVVHP